MVDVEKLLEWQTPRLIENVVVLAAFLAGCSQSGLAEVETPRLDDACELTPVFIEEFDTLDVAAYDLGNGTWTAHTPWNGDFGDAVFIDPEPGRPFRVYNGILFITATKDEEGKWTSGLLAGADATGAGTGARYGYFEARMKMPEGPGVWPAFWLMPLQEVGSVDQSVEIDVVEYYGREPMVYRTALHVWSHVGEEARGSGDAIKTRGIALADDFHTYGVDLSPQNTVYFFDGEEVWRQPTPPEMTRKMYPLVNLALGSGWPIDKTPNPSILQVDYVRVFERSAAVTDCVPGLPANTETAAE